MSTVQDKFHWATRHHLAGELPAAEKLYREVLALVPNHFQALQNLGAIAGAVGRYDLAIDFLNRAIAVNANLPDAHYNLGNALHDMARHDEALAAYERAIQLAPGNVDAHSAMVFAAHSHSKYSARDLLAELRRWSRCHAEPLAGFIKPHTNTPHEQRPLRIGYISADLRDHVIGHCMLPILRNSDTHRYPSYLYSQMTDQPDKVTDELRSLCQGWRDISQEPDEAVASQIRQDGIDVLVDLMLHTSRNRLLVFARKPAPVQVTFLAYAGSSGLGAMDYRLSDPYLDPPETDLSVYSEQTWRLPKTYWCYVPRCDFRKAPRSGAGVVFGCLNHYSKVSKPALDLWSRLLLELPGSRLRLYAPQGGAREDVWKRLGTHGIARERIDFVGWQPFDGYMRSLGEMDVALDPFPYGGGITTLDTLWMETPVVTLRGRTGVGRGGASILSNIGLGELIADTPEQYVHLAVDLAGNSARRAELRGGLRKRILGSALTDVAGYTQDVEAAFRGMWIEWCCSKKSDPLK
jgi:predicted O-linked N-acetylglucosamine transferase (SPINDLY family)